MATPAQPAVNEKLKPAMLSVYYHALGDQLQTRGSAAALVRPEVEPMPLDEALDCLARDAIRRDDWSRVREALWALIRSVSPPRGEDDCKEKMILERYGTELPAFVADHRLFNLGQFDSDRMSCRRDARLFSAALVAYPQQLSAPIGLYNQEVATKSSKFESATRNTSVLGKGVSAADFLAQIDGLPSVPPEIKDGRRTPVPNTREAVSQALNRLEDEVGVTIDGYIAAFADTVMFMDLWRETNHWDPSQPVTIFPSFSVTTQDAATLTTSVTATALVTPAEFLCITRAIDPRRWQKLSDQFHRVRFVMDEFATQAEEIETPIGEGLRARTRPYLVEEKVGVASDVVGAEVGYFHNVLQIDTFDVQVGAAPENCFADLEFSLYRSLDSKVLWDVRPGGLLIDSGWTKVRHVSDNTWRLTANKTLRFADRTPRTGWDGPLDFGQMLNYLAPAALTAWLNNDLYSSEAEEVHGTHDTGDY
ncbi:hypothetical protein OM076_42875 [Solirubrobacter ginsenosidimutans]|uniref:Uncharacterized protein n=1 Tax=Solirubrobacter ginsenosidimutans TaxID=490573 RepID=A0A9X3N2G6_9ACTN|nr:hypothetical protein [Solirubrobacter ginsenosidimutans]MDA0167082.1 hypothetical protein [Solirubrobacter ginsenosidimutans]